eukprot:1554415-Alexandrium_andersonii.AAC.1
MSARGGKGGGWWAGTQVDWNPPMDWKPPMGWDARKDPARSNQAQVDWKPPMAPEHRCHHRPYL